MSAGNVDFATLRALFDACADMPTSEQKAFVATQPDLDEQQRSMVLAWLQADAAADRTERSDVVQTLGNDWVQSRHAALQSYWFGRRIGPFLVRELLGQGGMGSVWKAERIEGGFAQRVAIKLLATARPVSAVQMQRFAAEREMLAGLRHPGIAGLLDGGETEDGVPYLVMELIDGQPIDTWCKAHASSLGERVGLLLQACSALQAAHAALVIHRDIKPANILVDAQGQVRLVDFGIARVLDASMADAPATAQGERLMTLGYASPEQLRGDPTGIASDVYSLGLVAYELLCGKPAQADSALGLVTQIRQICEDDPPPPSTVGDAGLRHAGLGRELDAIIMKALRKAPEQRYPTIDALAADLVRWQNRQPVDALRADRWYVWRKRVHRSRGALIAAGLLVGMLTAVALNWRWQSLQLAVERDKALVATRFMSAMFERANPASHLGKVPDAIQMAEQGAAELLQDSDLDAETRALLCHTNGRVLLALGQFSRALELANRGLSVLPQEEPAFAETRVELLLLKAEALAEMADWNDAVASVKDARDALAEVRDEDARRWLAVRLLDRQARLDLDRHESAAVAANLPKALQAANALVDAEMDHTPLDARRQSARELLASILLTRCRHSVAQASSHAESYCEQAQSYRERVFPPDHPGRLNALQELAVLAGNRGEGQEALRLSERLLAQTRGVFGDGHPRTAVAALNLGVEYRIAGRYDAAEAQYRFAYAVLRQTRGESHPHTLMVRNNWANVAYAREDFDTALTLHREVQAHRREQLAPNDPELAQSATNVAKCLWRLGRWREALAELDASMVPEEPSARRTQTMLRLFLEMQRGEFGDMESRITRLQQEIAAASPDTRGSAAIAWLALLYLEHRHADHSQLQQAWQALREAMRSDDGRELVSEREVASWERTHADIVPASASAD